MKSYLLQPLRGRDRTDKKTDRTVSPINDNVEKKRTVAGGLIRAIERSPIVSRSTGQSLAAKPKIKIIEKENNLTRSPENHDTSFEEEEKRIRRENLIKEFIMILGRKSEAVESEARLWFFDALRRSHKVYDVHLSYALELRNTTLKTSMLKMWKRATEKHKFRSKLIKNFARTIERACKCKFEEIYEDSIRKIKNVKRLPHTRPTKKVNIPANLNKTSGSTTQYSSNMQALNNSKEAALQRSPQRNSPKKSIIPEARAVVGSSHSNLKKASTSTSRQIKPKPEEAVKTHELPSKKESIPPRPATPVRTSKAKQEPRSSKLAKKESPPRNDTLSARKVKERPPIKILNSSVDESIAKKSSIRNEGIRALSRSTDRQLGEHKKMGVGQLIPKIKTNSLIAPSNGIIVIEKSKSQTSTTTAQSSMIDTMVSDKNLVLDKASILTETHQSASQPTQQNMISRHQDMKNRLLEQIRAREAEAEDEECEDSEESEHASVHRPVPSPVPDSSQTTRLPEVDNLRESRDGQNQHPGLGYPPSDEGRKPVNQSMLSDNASTKVSIQDTGNMSHASIKQRYLDEIQAFKANHSALLSLPKSQEKPNIFFNSLTDKSKDEHLEEELDSILDPKTEQKLFRLQYRKAFRMKAYFSINPRQLFESFLQNFIRNYEEQKERDELLGKKKLQRILAAWKSIPSDPVSKPNKSLTQEIKKESKGEQKIEKADSLALPPQLEQEYMILAAEFRKVINI